MKFFTLLVCTVCLLACQNVIAQTALQTSFESAQGYAIGNLHNQNAWKVTNGTAVVSTAKVHSGTQAINLSASNAALLVDYIAYSGSVPGITGEVYADMWVNPTSFTTKGIAINGYDLYSSSQKRIFVIEFGTDNTIKAYNGSATVNVGSWVSNQWVRISIKADFSAEKYKVAINGAVFATDMNFRETYTPTASGTRVATVKEFHSLRFNHSADVTIATSDAAVDDIYIGTTPIADVSFGASSTTRTITVTQPAYGTITLNPATSTYQLNQSVTATLTLPQGYMNNGWTGDLSGTALVQNFTVTANMVIGANVSVDLSNPPPKYKITINAPANGTITLSPSSPDSMYYKESSVTATIAYEACYQFNGWTGDLSGIQASKTFTVQNNVTIGADIVPNTTPSIKRTVSTVTEFKNALAAMNPGDTVEVNNGSYNLSSLTITRSGCGMKPILIMAKNQGQAILNGATALVLESLKYVTIQGFSFQAANIGTGIKILNSSRVRITRNSFNITENASCNWVYIGDTFGSPDSLKSGSNKVDYNVFDGKTQPGKYIVLDGNIDQQSRHDTISYNLFKNNGPRVDNEKESIRVGVSTLTRSSGYTVIEYNRFVDCDGDPEIVSIKSCDNIVRYNTFVRCLGTLSFRQGFRNTAEGNYFFGEGKTAVFNGGTIGCGGMRVYAKDHKIINNYFHGLTGSKWDAAITITNGNVLNSTTSNSEHNIPENLTVAFNTLNNNASNIEIGFDNGGDYSKAPVNCLIANNIVVDSLNPIIKSYSNTSLAGVSFSNNIMYSTGSSSTGIATTPAQINNVDPQLMQPTCVTSGTPCTAMYAYKVKRLSPASPAIDAANGSYSYVTNDFERTLRTSLKDIGAHEYTGNAAVTTGPLEDEHVGPNAVEYSYAYNYSSTLPVKLLDFNVTYKTSAVQLQWSVAEELNVKAYEIEWSVDGRQFSKVNSVNATGTSMYYSLHNSPAVGKNYYRLKIVDKDSKVSYSPVRVINTNEKVQVRIYPNPAQNFISIDIDGWQTAGTKLRIVNALGVVVKSLASASSSTINIQDLPAGVYSLQVIVTGEQVMNYPFNVVR
jgi:poly(beta-D-mannuronate) lyase